MPETRVSEQMPDRMLSCKSAAELVGLSESRLRHMWKEWGLSGYRVGGSLRFRESEVWAWLESRRIAA